MEFENVANELNYYLMKFVTDPSSFTEEDGASLEKFLLSREHLGMHDYKKYFRYCEISRKFKSAFLSTGHGSWYYEFMDLPLNNGRNWIKTVNNFEKQQKGFYPANKSLTEK